MEKHRLVELLRRAAAAHHEAYAETDGRDPNWPNWYARYLTEHGFDYEPGEDELAIRLRELDHEHEAIGRPSDWAMFYADRLGA